MRNIKFRVWNNRSARMWSVDKMLWESDGSCHPIVYFTYTDNDKLMQSTGLRDVGGNEIFEGDIVEFATSDAIGAVVYEPPAFKTKDHSLQGYDCKVIGNIYENPELLT